MSLHDRVEAAFERWGRLVCRWRWPTVASTLLATLALGAFLPRIEADFSAESYLRAGDPALEAYDRFRAEFGRDDRILIGIEPPEVFDLAFLEKLRALHRDLEAEVPYVDEVLSLVNARWTRGEGDELIVEELMAEPPADAADLAALRERVFSNPLYINTLISRDARFTTLTIEPLTYSPGTRPEAAALGGFDDDEPGEGEGEGGVEPPYLGVPEQHELVTAVDAVVERHREPGLPIHAVGAAVLGSHVRDAAERDAIVFVSSALLLIGALLFALFRRLSGVILPLVVIAATLVAAAGCMGLLRIPFSPVTQILPTFLIAIGICDAVHILTIVYRRISLGDGRVDAIAFALRHSGLAVVMTSLTTAGGLVSFVAAEIAPVSNLGVLSPLGVLLALGYTLTLLPALLAIVPLRGPERHGDGWRAPERLLARLGDLATRRPRSVLAVSLAIVGVGLVGIAQLRFAHHIVENLPEDDPHRIALERVDEKFEGTAVIEVLIDTGRPAGLHEPELLRRLEAAPARAAALARPPLALGGSVSLVDLLKEIHRALHENRPEAYVLPDERALVAQELLLFESSGSDDLEDFTDYEYRTGRLTLRVPWVDGTHYPPYLERLEAALGELLGPDVDLELTGGTALHARTFVGVIRSLARSYLLALAIITPLMVLLIGSLRRGLLCMIPNLIPVVLTLGFMGWIDISLNFSTLLLGSVVIGVAVDDTIHFMHQFHRHWAATGDVAHAVHETLVTTGTAMLVTSIVLTTAFGIFVLGTVTGTVSFGLLTAFATVIAFLADVLVAPALMTLALGKREGRSRVRAAA